MYSLVSQRYLDDDGNYIQNLSLEPIEEKDWDAMQVCQIFLWIRRDLIISLNSQYNPKDMRNRPLLVWLLGSISTNLSPITMPKCKLKSMVLCKLTSQSFL